MPDRRIYLDYSATAPVRPGVRESMQPYVEDAFGNPSSLYSYGLEARAALENARDGLRGALGASDWHLAFTGSGSASDNLAVLGFGRRHPEGRIVRSGIEHKAVLESTRALAAAGHDVREAPVDAEGVLDLGALAELLPDDGRPSLVSVMWANNETGVVQPIADLSRLCRERGAVLHSDAVQAFGKLPIDLRDCPVDLLTVSGHKLGGPKGVGALLYRRELELEPLIYGGGHEDGLVSGTQNVAGAVGFAAAARLAVEELEGETSRLRELRDELERSLTAAVPDVVINGGGARRLPHILGVSVPGVDIEGLLTSLDLEGVCISSGSACTTGSVEPSHVMRAMGREGDLARNTIRMSLGWGTTRADVEYAAEVFPRVVQRVREFARR